MALRAARFARLLGRLGLGLVGLDFWFQGTLGLACEPRPPGCVRPMWLALGTVLLSLSYVVGL